MRPYTSRSSIHGDPDYELTFALDNFTDSDVMRRTFLIAFLCAPIDGATP